MDTIISGDSTKPVSPGWAMGPFYDKATIAHTSRFEVKVWGGRPQGPDGARPRSQQPGSYSQDWLAHEGGGSEYIHVFSGELNIHFGFRNPESGAVEELKELSPITVQAGETVILPEGLFRKFSAREEQDALLRALTVRAAPDSNQAEPKGSRLPSARHPGAPR
jgi:hypothetical protein